MLVRLFSAVARFFRHSPGHWHATEHVLGEQASAYNKQLLKEMIERKRRNDFVRKREFDILRKMHKREALSGQELGVARPSFFQSSLPSTPDDRAVTLKKIDEIEAQMSMQWWKTNHGSMPASTGGGGSSSFPASLQTNSEPVLSSPESLLDNALPGSYAATAPLPLVPTRPGVSQPMPVLEHPADRQFQTAQASSTGRSVDVKTPGLMSSKTLAVEVDTIVHDPELEEAAIYFSNGENAQAETCLKDALGLEGTRAHHLETWLTLFDFYRVTGCQENFESLALDFVHRFGRSAPQWFCLPELVQSLRDTNSPAVDAAQQPTAHWVCPAELNTQALTALDLVLRQTSAPWCLAWGEMRTLDAQAVRPLCHLMEHWASQSAVQLQMLDSDQLLYVLKARTQAVDVAQEPDWQLLMQTLRVLHRPDDFELVALDFCVRCHVSPPAWKVAACRCNVLDNHASFAGQTIIGDAYRDTVVEGYPSETHTTCNIDLSGTIQGDAVASVLQEVERKCENEKAMQINCMRLIRVDFSAAGTLLNWAVARQSEGRFVHFTHVNRLVAAFFNTMGISAHARVSVRAE